jgi:hypothetical protein
MTQGLQSLISVAIALALLAAVVLLLRQSRSAWLILAIVAESASLLCRGVMFAAPDLVRTTPVFFSLWTLSSLAFAVGRLGYAIETTQRR